MVADYQESAGEMLSGRQQLLVDGNLAIQPRRASAEIFSSFNGPSVIGSRFLETLNDLFDIPPADALPSFILVQSPFVTLASVQEIQ